MSPPRKPPTAPNDLTASAVSSSQVRLNWSDPSSNEPGFIVEQDGGCGFVLLGTVPADTSNCISDGLQPEKTYRYRVRAFNAYGLSGYSNVVQATTLAEAPTPIESFQEEHGIVINVKNYGATGDGSSDDRAAIQAAIDASLSAGHKVYLPYGVYMVGGEVIVKQEIQLIGDGPTSTIIGALPSFPFPDQETAILHQQTNDGTLVKIGTWTPMGRIYLKDLKVYGANVAGANGILASCQQQAVWDNVRVDNCPGYGLALADGQQIVLRNMEFIQCGRAILISGHSFVYAHDLNIERCVTDNIYVKRGVSNIIPYACSFENLHLENQTHAPILIHVNEAEGISFSNVFATIEAETLFQFDNPCIYTLRDIRAYGLPDQTTMLLDSANGVNANAFWTFRNHILYLSVDNGFSGIYLAGSGAAGLRKL